MNRVILCSFCLFIQVLAAAQSGKVTVNVDQPGHKISPTFYGLMTEEINHAYDGGLYAELIRNRAFKDGKVEPVGWALIADNGGSGTINLDQTQPVPGAALTSSLRIDITTAGPNRRVGAANEGYWGIPTWSNTRYTASFFAKASPGFNGPLSLSIETMDGAQVFALATVSGIGSSWKRYSADLSTAFAIPRSPQVSRFVIAANRPGTIWVTQVSLMPPTFHNRPNGNRIDLMKKLDYMNQSFLRLPGGNYLEGDTIADRFDWKSTIGDLSKRPGHQGPWQYRSSDGLGLLEFLEWCEDLRIQPVLAVYAGFSLQGEHVDPGTALAPYVQDALDEIEYVTGDTHTHWGAIRAQNGHPKPFPLTYVEVGNEDSFDRSRSYAGRFAQFFDAIKEHYPRLQLIATMPVRSRKPDLVDDHYYRSAEAMARDSHHYDNADRNGPKIFVGEWASIEGRPTPTYRAALGDAAWLTGLERNSDLVLMESYAPLLTNVNEGASQWPTNLIGYNSLNSFGSPSYWVQALFARNTGDVVLPTELSVSLPKEAAVIYHGAIGLGTYSTDSEYKDLEVTHDGQTLYKKDFSTGTEGWSFGRGNWKAENGALHQSSDLTNTRATAGDPTWTDYTIRVKARKLSGNEGFFVLFHYLNAGSYWQWNVGGWGDSRSALQHQEGANIQEVGRASPATVETGRWYDLRVELQGGKVRCYLNDKLVNEATEERTPLDPIYVAATRSNSGEVILKVVNVSATSIPLQLDLRGSETWAVAAGWQMTGDPDDQNSVDAPEKVAPKPITVKGVGASLTHDFPAYSVTVLRLRSRR